MRCAWRIAGRVAVVAAAMAAGCAGGMGTGGGTGTVLWSGDAFDVPLLEVDARMTGRWRDGNRGVDYIIAKDGGVTAVWGEGDRFKREIRPLVINPGRLEWTTSGTETLPEVKNLLLLLVEPDKLVRTERPADAGRGAWEPVTVLGRVEAGDAKP